MVEEDPSVEQAEAAAEAAAGQAQVPKLTTSENLTKVFQVVVAEVEAALPQRKMIRVAVSVAELDRAFLVYHPVVEAVVEVAPAQRRVLAEGQASEASYMVCVLNQKFHAGYSMQVLVVEDQEPLEDLALEALGLEVAPESSTRRATLLEAVAAVVEHRLVEAVAAAVTQLSHSIAAAFSRWQ